MNVRKLLAATSIASSVLPLSASTAFAGTSRASVSVTQNQGSWSSKPVSFEQSALTETSTFLGNSGCGCTNPCGCSGGDAWATSKSAGSQVSTGIGNGGQHQRVSSGASLTWADNTWPAKTTATTTGGVYQTQRGWSLPQHMMSFEQAGGTWQASFVGGNKSTAEGTGHQKSTGTAVGYGAQVQNIQGSTSTQGFSDPPFPRSVSLPFGGRLVTTIQALIQSVIQF